jgi:hypothetical protein
MFHNPDGTVRGQRKVDTQAKPKSCFECKHLVKGQDNLICGKEGALLIKRIALKIPVWCHYSANHKKDIADD